jgi:predicted DNA-binding transcriptional regulator AlpA
MTTAVSITGMLNKTDLCTRLNVSPRTIENMIRDGRFPPPVQLGKYVYWGEAVVAKWQQRLLSEQEGWFASHPVTPRASPR